MDTLILLVALVLAILFLRHLRMMPEYYANIKEECLKAKKYEISKCCTLPLSKRTAPEIACCYSATSKVC